MGSVTLAVAAITLVGLLVRLPSFGDSLFGDELSAFYVVHGHGLRETLHLVKAGNSTELNPPLFFALAWLSEKIFGSSTESLKLVSLIAGTATIPLTFLLGRRTIGHATGLVAAVLTALCPFLIYYSTEARPYALLVLVLLLSTLALLQALDTGRWIWWAAYALFTCAAMYTHYTAVFLLGAQFAWALVTHRDRWRPLVVATAAAAIAFLPWLPTVRDTTNSPGTKIYALLEPFTLHAVRIDLGRWAIGHPYVPLSVIPGSMAAWLAVAGVGVATLGAIVSARRGRLLVSTKLALVIVLALAAPVGIAIYSSFEDPIWNARNVLSSWPGFAVLLGALLTWPRGTWRVAAVGLTVVGFGIGAVKMSDPNHQRLDYQAAARYIDRSTPAGAPVVDLVAPTPGPPTAVEAALALDGGSARHPVLRIGLPPLRAVLRAKPYAKLDSTPGESVAREAVRLAGDGPLLIVVPGAAPLSTLESARHAAPSAAKDELARFGQFLHALPPRFHPVARRSFRGMLPLGVYEYRG
ncbi:MAG: glycosyltransferase family 39 protein [Thermoleophilaceae bacterium]